jgi:hypothetical protein
MIKSNVPVEWQKYLDKNTTSNFEVIRVEESQKNLNGFDGVAFVRVKSSKRILNFEAPSGGSTIKYFLDLPDMLFVISFFVNQTQKIIISNQVDVFGLDENNQLLVLPLTNIDYGELCCDFINTKYNEYDEYDEKVLFEHLKSQVNEFFHEEFNYELPHNMSNYINLNWETIEDDCHSVWKQWSQDTIQNKKFNFVKCSASETIYFEEDYVDFFKEDDDEEDDDFDEEDDDFDEDDDDFDEEDDDFDEDDDDFDEDDDDFDEEDDD